MCIHIETLNIRILSTSQKRCTYKYMKKYICKTVKQKYGPQSQKQQYINVIDVICDCLKRMVQYTGRPKGLKLMYCCRELHLFMATDRAVVHTLSCLIESWVKNTIVVS